MLLCDDVREKLLDIEVAGSSGKSSRNGFVWCLVLVVGKWTCGVADAGIKSGCCPFCCSVDIVGVWNSLDDSLICSKL
jgi:hypothetical protein